MGATRWNLQTRKNINQSSKTKIKKKYVKGGGEVLHFWTRGTNGQNFFHSKLIIEKFNKITKYIRVLRLPYRD
jgi:hypothetical protein